MRLVLELHQQNGKSYSGFLLAAAGLLISRNLELGNPETCRDDP
jgi:hypothetical protein